MEGVWGLPTSKMEGLFGSKACAVCWRSGMRRVGGRGWGVGCCGGLKMSQTSALR